MEPSEKNYYQPGWTLVGADLLKMKQTEDDTKKYIPQGIFIIIIIIIILFIY